MTSAACIATATCVAAPTPMIPVTTGISIIADDFPLVTHCGAGPPQATQCKLPDARPPRTLAQRSMPAVVVKPNWRSAR